MPPTEDFVRSIFKSLEQGAGDDFFEHVAEDVDWTVMGTHPLAGRYRSKASFREATFARLAKILPNGAQLHLEHLIVAGDQAVVELRSDATARNGLKFDNRYCWVMRFKDQVVVEVRAYLDSALVARALEENPTN